MKRLRIAFLFLAVLLVARVQDLAACTVIAVGTEASADGSTIATHNDDSSGADFRLWITRGQKWPAGAKRDIVADSHNYGDFGKYPKVKDYGAGMLVGEMPEAPLTYSYFHSRYSFINEKGVSMGEATHRNDFKSTELRKKTGDLLFGKNTGLIDCWNAQDIALERATTAKEAAQIMGDLVEKFGWKDPGETINIADGKEVWIAEYYGRDLWCAVRMPKNAFFVAANHARIHSFDFNDKENYIGSPNLKSFAVENGLWSEASGLPFDPAEIYSPFKAGDVYSTRREWRILDLVAPSLKLDPNAETFPLFVVPEKKLSVADVYKLTADYYEGTDYDLTRQPLSGPYGEPQNPYHIERSVNCFRSCYVMIAHVKGWLPDAAKCLVWYGYGAADTNYLTPLWPTMTKLPELYTIGNRYEEFRRDSGWWTNSYVQQVARTYYTGAIKQIREMRDPRMEKIYKETDAIQNQAAELIKAKKDKKAIELLTKYGNDTAVAWHKDWLFLGDQLMGRFMWTKDKMKDLPASKWWNDIMKAAPVRPAEEMKK
ncbi:MAG TPA: C69 family dipeptidase [Spirochaetia bacterium]|nr:C69 family dipeptidase [Spirochaetia bacterium]